MSRRTPLRRLGAAAAFCLALLAQPQLLCGLHCLVMSHAMAAAMPHDQTGQGHAPRPMGMCHGSAVTGHPAPRVGRVASTWIPAGTLSLSAATGLSLSLVTPDDAATSHHSGPESPPPRA